MEENRTLAQIKPTILKNLPVSKSFDQQVVSKIESMTNEIIENHISKSIDLNKNLESQIDQLVYELYGLTEEEIGIVEDAVK